MKVLVIGASGNTGKLVVKQLLNNSIKTRVLIRKSAVLSKEILDSPLIEVIRDSISEMNQDKIDNLIANCDVIISCLGHNMTFKGMFFKPRNLVVDAIKKICVSAKRSNNKIKIILMSTTAYTNHSLGEKNSFGERIVLSIVKLLLPPHRDNIKVANYLVKDINTQDKTIKWIAIRPDTLVNNDIETPYVIEKSPIRSPIFNAGKTSRINVSHFITNLVIDENLWKEWEYKTPVIYNK